MNEQQPQSVHASEPFPEGAASHGAEPVAEQEHVPEAVALDQAAVEPAAPVPEAIAHKDLPPEPAAIREAETNADAVAPRVSEADAVAPPVTEAHAVAPPVTEANAVAPTVTEADVPPAQVAEKPQKPEPTAAQLEGRRRAQEAWQRVSGAKTSGETLHGAVKSAIKGGLLMDIEGYRAFLPASQVRVPKGTAIETLVNEKIPVKVLDVDEQRKRLVVSHRRAVEQERRAARAELIASLKVGAEHSATVVRIADFGAFVDLGGVDALIPLGELAFERVEKTTDAVNVGDTFTVKILRVEENGKKVAASRKAALHDPWRDHADVVRQGAVIEGKVTSKEGRLEVEIAPGISGTLSDRDANPDDYAIGEAIEVTVRSVDFRNRRIRLGTPQAAQTFTSSGFAPLGAELGIKSGE